MYSTSPGLVSMNWSVKVENSFKYTIKEAWMSKLNSLSSLITRKSALKRIELSVIWSDHPYSCSINRRSNSSDCNSRSSSLVQGNPFIQICPKRKRKLLLLSSTITTESIWESSSQGMLLILKCIEAFGIPEPNTLGLSIASLEISEL